MIPLDGGYLMSMTMIGDAQRTKYTAAHAPTIDWGVVIAFIGTMLFGATLALVGFWSR